MPLCNSIIEFQPVRIATRHARCALNDPLLADDTVVTGLTILSGDDRISHNAPTGKTKTAGDRVAWDKVHEDTDGSPGGGVFALQTNGERAVQRDGNWYDISVRIVLFSVVVTVYRATV